MLLAAIASALAADGDLLSAERARRDRARCSPSCGAARDGDRSRGDRAIAEGAADGTEAFAAERMNRGIRRRWPGAASRNSDMPTIKVLPHAEYCPEGRAIEASRATSICEALLENGIADRARLRDELRLHDLPRRRARGLPSLGEMDESEEDLLDRAWGLEPTSRLSCQAILAQQDVTVEIPKYSINHAKEKH